MLSLALIGLVGGLITGISPCILPVLPVIFFSGTQSTADGATAVKSKREVLRPYRVIGGLVLSFSLVTLVGSALLSLLHLPQDAIRWVALVALVAIGLGLIFPRFEELLERPFARLPQKQIAGRANGFGLGLALGVLYVPCAGPVLAAIVVAGATANIGLPVVVLTVAFALGTAVPLLFFALAGQRVTQRISAFRRHQRQIRVTAGIVTLLLAVALVFNLPAALQRAIPDYTSSLQNKVGGDEQLQQKLGGIVNDQNKELANCTSGSTQLQNCGPAPDLRGINAWLNTPAALPIDLKALRGKVVLIDFWAYSCINCQRAIPHVEGWYKAYQDDGFEVIGVHTPEYAFEKVTGNVKNGAADIGITYPIALDNSYSTWTHHRKAYPPAYFNRPARGQPAAGGGRARHHSGRGPDPGDIFRCWQDGQLRRRRRLRQGTGQLHLPGGTAERHLRTAGPVDTRLPGRDGRQRFLQHQAELPRQKRLPRCRRNREPDGDARREGDDGTGQRAADLASDRRRQGRGPRTTRRPFR